MKGGARHRQTLQRASSIRLCAEPGCHSKLFLRMQIYGATYLGFFILSLLFKECALEALLVWGCRLPLSRKERPASDGAGPCAHSRAAPGVSMWEGAPMALVLRPFHMRPPQSMLVPLCSRTGHSQRHPPSFLSTQILPLTPASAKCLRPQHISGHPGLVCTGLSDPISSRRS